jgi:hypothetical protein
MRDVEEEPRPRYSGPFVCIRPVDGFSWSVGIEPILSTGEGEPRTYGSKSEAFGAARALWSDHRLPCRDMTVGETARAHPDE